MTDEVRAQLVGPVPSIRTPFASNGDIDFEALDRVVDRCLDGGAEVLMLTAGDSHYLCLSDQEIAEVTKAVCRRARGRAEVIAADRLHATRRAVEFAQYAESVGAFCVMTMPPDWSGSTTAESLAVHYATVAQALPVMIVTNVFLPRGAEFGLEVIDRVLTSSTSVVAVKDDFGGVFCRELVLRFGELVSILPGGQKVNHLAMEPFGGTPGYLSTFAALVPEVANRYWTAVEGRDLTTARAICAQVDIPFFDLVAAMPGGFDAGIHAAMEAVGVAGRHRRPPYYSLSESEAGQVRDFIDSVPARLARC